MFFDVDRSEWPKPNYDNPQLAGQYLIGIEYILLALSTTVVGLRLVSRGYLLKTLGWDDFCAVASWAFAVILTASNIVLIEKGYGRHIYDVVPKNRRDLLLNVWLYQWVAAISTGFSKMSILYFLLRFIDGKIARRCVHATMVYVVAWSFTCAMVWMFRCTPVSWWWSSNGRGLQGRCMSTEWFIKTTGIQAAFGALSHTFIMFLPISTLWKLNLSTWKKMWFIFVLWMGGSCCAFASGRLYYTIMGVRKVDMTWYGYHALLFQGLEVHSQVFYTCTPFLGPTAQAISKPVVAGLKKISGSALSSAVSASRNRSSVVQSNANIPNGEESGFSPNLAEKQVPTIAMYPADTVIYEELSPIRSISRGGVAGRLGSSAGTVNSSNSSLSIRLNADVESEAGSQGLTPPTPPRSSYH